LAFDAETITPVDRFTFISNLVSSLGWPLTAIGIALLFRKGILARIPNLTKVKAGAFEAEFAESAPILKGPPAEEPAEEIPTSEPRAVGTPDRLNDLQRELIESAKSVVDVDPRLTVLQAYRALEITINRLLRSLDIPYGQGARGPRTFVPVETALRKAELISPDDTDRLSELRKLRNLAAHDTPDEITATTALEYVDAAERLLVAVNEGAERKQSSRHNDGRER
jgi:uncharacterized protein YutE (UPF0331/DUF86 family)